MNNAFIKSQLFDGNRIHLGYRKDSCRFTDDLPDLLKYIRDTGRIPQYFANKILNPNIYDLDFYLCMKKDDQVIKIAKAISIRKCENVPDNEKLYHGGYCFSAGMPLVCMSNVRKLDKLALYTTDPLARKNMSLLFQSFNLWKSIPRASNRIAVSNAFKIKQKAIPGQCNLIYFAEQIGLELSKLQKTKMKQFQCIINFQLYYIKSVIRAWQTVNNATKNKKKFNEYHRLQNKLTTTIEYINIDNQSVNLADGKCNIPIYLISRYFQPDYARTIDSFQGDKLTKPFGIVGLNYKMASVERLNSVFGRAVSKDLIWIDYYNENKIYRFKKYPDNIDINPVPIATKYSNVLFDYITYNEKPVQIGSTTQSLDERLEWHKLQIQRGSTAPLHEFMQNADPEQLDIISIYDAPIDMDNAQKTEDHEM